MTNGAHDLDLLRLAGEPDLDPLRLAGEPELQRELVRLRALESAAREFCERCERGEIRSEQTYRRFRAALDGGGEPLD